MRSVLFSLVVLMITSCVSAPPVRTADEFMPTYNPVSQQFVSPVSYKFMDSPWMNNKLPSEAEIKELGRQRKRENDAALRLQEQRSYGVYVNNSAPVITEDDVDDIIAEKMTTPGE